jgi:hypothetical protein
MNPLWFLIAYQLGKSSSSCCDRDDDDNSYSRSSLSTDSLDNTVAFFYTLLVGWLAFPSAWLFNFNPDPTLPSFLQALIMLEPVFISLPAFFAYFYFDLTNCSSGKILLGWLVGALLLGGLWYFSHIGLLDSLTTTTKLILAALPPALMVATNVISRKLSRK